MFRESVKRPRWRPGACQFGFARTSAAAVVLFFLLAVSTAYLAVRGSAATKELRRLRAENEKLRQSIMDPAELERLNNQRLEIQRLRKENQELHKLRNEVSALRRAREELEAAQNDLAAAAEQNAGLKAESKELERLFEQLAEQLPTAREELDRFVRESPPELAEFIESSRGAAEANACQGMLRMIQGAIAQWALETKKQEGAPVVFEELKPYMKSLPSCPAQGAQSVTFVGELPVCSIHGALKM